MTIIHDFKFFIFPHPHILIQLQQRDLCFDAWEIKMITISYTDQKKENNTILSVEKLLFYQDEEVL